MTLATVSKWLALAGGTISTAALNNAFGKWSQAVSGLGAALVAMSAAVSSSTSAGHPNGAATPEPVPVVDNPHRNIGVGR